MPNFDVDYLMICVANNISGLKLCMCIFLYTIHNFFWPGLKTLYTFSNVSFVSRDIVHIGHNKMTSYFLASTKKYSHAHDLIVL